MKSTTPLSPRTDVGIPLFLGGFILIWATGGWPGLVGGVMLFWGCIFIDPGKWRGRAYFHAVAVLFRGHAVAQALGKKPSGQSNMEALELFKDGKECLYLDPGDAEEDDKRTLRRHGLFDDRPRDYCKGEFYKGSYWCPWDGTNFKGAKNGEKCPRCGGIIRGKDSSLARSDDSH